MTKAADARKLFDDAKAAMSEQHERMREDLLFSNPADPRQWPDDIQRIRQNASGGPRPCMVFDQTNQYIAQVVNDARQNKPSIQCFPADGGADKKTAKALEGMIRHIEYSSRAGIAYDAAIEMTARVGLGWLRVVPEVIDPALNLQEIRIKRVYDPLSVVLDPDSSEPDGADAEFGFVEHNMTKSAFKAKYPDASDKSWDSEQSGWYGEDTIRVCELQKVEKKKSNRIVISLEGQQMTLTEDEYWRLAQQIGFKPDVVSTYMEEERVVKWLKFNAEDVLEETEFPSKYLGIIPVIGDELFVDGKRYLCGLTRRMRHGQMAYNYERSAYIESVALQPKAPYLMPVESVAGFENEWGRANSENYAYLPFNHIDEAGNPLPPPQRLAPPILPAAFINGAQQAMADIQASVGMYAASLGRRGNATSGKQELAQQREGDTATFHYIDNQSRSIEQLGRVVVDMLPRIYDTKREARILGEDGSSSLVVIDPNGRDENTINLTTGTYDVRVKAGPSYTTLRQETNEALGQIIQSAPQLMPVLGPTWAKLQDWPDADKISKLLLAMAPPQVQAIAADESQEEISPHVAAQMQQMQQAMQQQGQMIEQMQAALQQAQDETDKVILEAAAKKQELEIKAYDAETKRLQVIQTGLTPQDVQTLVMQTMQDLMTYGAGAQGYGDQQETLPMDGMQHESMEIPQQESMEQQEFQEAQPSGIGDDGQFSGENLA